LDHPNMSWRLWARQYERMPMDYSSGAAP